MEEKKRPHEEGKRRKYGSVLWPTERPMWSALLPHTARMLKKNPYLLNKVLAQFVQKGSAKSYKTLAHVLQTGSAP